MNNKEKNGRLLDENRFKVAKQNAVMPGGPENNSPLNVTNFGAQNVEADSIYGDHRQAYAQMGDTVLDPQRYGPSGILQPNVVGQGLNSRAAYNMQPQPSANVEEAFEGMRQAQDASNRGLIASEYMGITGTPAIIPGAMDPQIPGQGAPLMQPMITVDGPQGNNSRKNSKGKA